MRGSAFPALAVLFSMLAHGVATAQDRSVSIRQSGSDNAATIEQVGATRSAVAVEQLGSDLTARVTDIGSDTEFGLRQEGVEQTAIVRLDASNTVGRIDQRGGINEALVTVAGVDNSFTVDQSSPGSAIAIGTGNSLVLSQSGGTNLATLSQNGTANAILLDQQVGGNTADLAQVGDGLVLDVSQFGGGNTLTGTQTGESAREIRVEQTGGATASITTIGPAR